jgi:hypothetical protein
MNAKRTAQAWVRSAQSVLTAGTPRSARLRDAMAHLEVPVHAPFDTALFNFTIDFELYWGNNKLGGTDRAVKRRLEAGLRQAENFGPFVALLKELRFPISWAVLGKLADPAAKPRDGLRFLPAWAGTKDLYEVPSALRPHPQAWHGERYLRVLREELPFCETLSHGFAHIDYGDSATSADIAREDVCLSRSLLESVGLPPRGFVYPWNSLGHEDVVREAGFKIVRGSTAAWHVDRQARFARTPAGFWISPGVLSFRDVRELIRRGIAKRSFIHPWMHLIECDMRCSDLADFYRPLFETVLEEGARGRLRNVGFGEVHSTLFS